MPDTPSPSPNVLPGRGIARLLAVMTALRTPVTGCPWDLEQTYQTIAPYTIEEAYEVADAIERGDRADMKEELGDLLLQVVYHARIAEEEGSFGFDDVVAGITDKMIRRHPHVFGDAAARSAGAAKGFWEKIKAEEKSARRAERQRLAGHSADKAVPPDAERQSVLDGVPPGMAALTRAIKLQEKAARVGFDWPSIGPVFDKMREELAELEVEVGKAAPATGSSSIKEQTLASGSAIEEEFGDLLFVMANVARHLTIDPEAALRKANQKFARRFHHIEDRLHAMGRSPADSTLDEMDALWNDAKAVERNGG